MRPIPTTKSTTSSPSLTNSYQHSTWHSPIPYLFGGLAAMLGLIAFALLILACSYWKLSGHHDDEENSNNNNRGMERNKEQGDSANKEPVKVYGEKILVIMAGDEKPTFLATPACAKCSSLVDGVGNHSDKDIKNRESLENKSEKEMDNNDVHVQATTLLSTQQPPQPQETTQEQSQLQ